MKRNVKEVLQAICFHCKILLRGFTKVVYGTVTAVLVCLAVYGFAAIPSEGGYAAVVDFISAAACIVVAVALMYSLGCKRSRR